MASVSVIIPTYNNLHLTIQCYESLLRQVVPDIPAEIIFVDNGSTDGTQGWIRDVASTRKGLKGLLLPKNTGFAGACNEGYKAAGGDIIVFLNNDTRVMDGFFRDIVRLSNKHPDMGLGGVISNYAGGAQQISTGYKNDAEMFALAKRPRKEYGDLSVHTGMVVGICLFAKRGVLNAIALDGLADGKLFDERFWPGMWEDNDICFRSYLKGFKNYVFWGLFVHHEGSQTFRKMESGCNGILERNRKVFEDKWRGILYKERKDHKVVAMLRVKNGERHIKRCLRSLEKWVDEIVVLDTGSTDRTVDYIRGFKKVVSFDGNTFAGKPLQEYNERQHLLEMARKREPTWIVRVDVDEIWEDDITKWLPRLLNPADPCTTHWRFPMKNFWRDEKKIRTDGIWGQMAPYGLFRNIPQHQLVDNHHPQGFHTQAVPEPPMLWVKTAPVNMLHYGYSCWEEIQRKAEWYRETDTEKRVEAIGTPNYDHLTDETNMQLEDYKPSPKLTVLMMIKDEWELAEKALEPLKYIVDRIRFVHTGDGKFDPDHRLAGHFYDVTKHKWDDNYSHPRNHGLSDIYDGWVLHLDPDESIRGDSLEKIRPLLSKQEADVYLVNIVNLVIDKPTGERRDSIQEAPRLFRAEAGLRYSNPVHETLDDSIRDKEGIRVRKADIFIEHYGFLIGKVSWLPGYEEGASDDRLGKKLQYYKKLNDDWARKSPLDPRPYYNLGMQALDEGDIENGIELLKRSESLNEMGLWQSSASLAGVYLGMAKEHIRKALSQLSKQNVSRRPMEKLLDVLNENAKDIVRVG